MSADDIGSIAFPYSHIAGPDYMLMMLAAGFGAVLVEAFVPADAVKRCSCVSVKQRSAVSGGPRTELTVAIRPPKAARASVGPQPPV